MVDQENGPGRQGDPVAQRRHLVASSGVGATAGISVLSILLSLGVTEAIAAVGAVVGIAAAGTLGALNRWRR